MMTRLRWLCVALALCGLLALAMWVSPQFRGRVVTFVTNEDFWINFVANLIGALVGVLLAFRFEQRRAKRDTTNVFGRVLTACRYRAYLFTVGPLRSARSKSGATQSDTL